jgi:hypothetical protein
MLKCLKNVRFVPKTRSRPFCQNIPEPTNEVEARYITLMNVYRHSKQLQANNNFLEASQILSKAVQKWRQNPYGESEMVLLHPLLKLAELYQSQGLDQKSILIYDELDAIITHVLIEHQQSLDKELDLDKKDELDKKIKNLRVLLANIMVDSGKAYMDNEEYALAQKKLKEGVSLITLAGQTASYEIHFAYAMLGLLYDCVGNYEEAEWYHVEVLKTIPHLEIWNHPHFSTVLNLAQVLTYASPLQPTNLNTDDKLLDQTKESEANIKEQPNMDENGVKNEKEQENRPTPIPSQEELERDRITALEMIKLIRINKKILPDQIHPSLVSTMIFVAFILRQQRQFNEAIEILTSLYDYYSSKDKKAMMATMACHIGMVHAEEGDSLTGERYFKEALHTRTIELGAFHVHTGLVSADLSLLYWKRGEVHNAIHLLTSAIRIFEKQLTDSHPFTQILKKTYHDLEDAFMQLSQQQDSISDPIAKSIKE